MNKLLLFLMMLISTQYSFGQLGTVKNNFFGHLEFNSADGRYTATLEKNFFNGLEFSDNARNTVTFEKKYLDRHMSGILSDNEMKVDFLKYLVRKYIRESGYRASHEIDILGKEIFEDNRGNSVESGVDIFGHEYYAEEGENGSISIKRNLDKSLTYTRNKFTATLKKDIFGVWVYNDNESGKIEFNQAAWNKMLERHRNERSILLFLVRQLTAFSQNEYYSDF